jgi:hypothetical protein
MAVHDCQILFCLEVSRLSTVILWWSMVVRQIRDLLGTVPSLEARTGQKQMIWRDCGRGVTQPRVYDPAEYQALIAALKDRVGRIQRVGKGPSDFSLLVHTNSQFMVGKLTQERAMAGFGTRDPAVAPGLRSA